jgi:hypothetical protein
LYKNSVAERSDDFIKIKSGNLELELDEATSEAPFPNQPPLARVVGTSAALRRRSPSRITAGINNKPPARANATPNEVTRPISTSGAKLEVISAPNPTIVVRFD